VDHRPATAPLAERPDFVVRKATRNKSLRITWVDGQTSVEVLFYAKGKSKSQVVVQHSQLSDAKAAERMKGYWSEQLARLQEFAANSPRDKHGRLSR
jgi:hypothetical protein